MANTRKHCQGTVHLRKVSVSFDEWVTGLDAQTINQGETICKICGDKCSCMFAHVDQSGLHMDLVCGNRHATKQTVSYTQLQRIYRCKDPTKLVSEEVYLSKYKKSDLPKRWRTWV